MEFRWNLREHFTNQSSARSFAQSSNDALGKNKAYEQIRMFLIESCAKQQIKIKDCQSKERLLRF